jgi:mRNA-degrading endonuclease RelE of RelBE toxin-antitoxin system
MNYKIVSTKEFEKDIKKLAKKHASLKADYAALLKELSQNPLTGTPLGNECFKIRLQIKSKSTGKSGGQG